MYYDKPDIYSLSFVFYCVPWILVHRRLLTRFQGGYKFDTEMYPRDTNFIHDSLSHEITHVNTFISVDFYIKSNWPNPITYADLHICRLFIWISEKVSRFLNSNLILHPIGLMYKDVTLWHQVVNCTKSVHVLFLYIIRVIRC